MEKIKTLEDFINEEIATVTGDVSKIPLVSDLGKAILKNASDKYASQYKKRVDELESVVSDLAQFALNQKRLVSRVEKIVR